MLNDSSHFSNPFLIVSYLFLCFAMNFFTFEYGIVSFFKTLSIIQPVCMINLKKISFVLVNDNSEKIISKEFINNSFALFASKKVSMFFNVSLTTLLFIT